MRGSPNIGDKANPISLLILTIKRELILTRMEITKRDEEEKKLNSLKGIGKPQCSAKKHNLYAASGNGLVTNTFI